MNGTSIKTVFIKKSPCCQICNDTASGKNYTVYTCESCRTFFKRNGRKLNKLTCRQEGKCPIDLTSRRNCSRCRLEKALSIGMAFKGEGKGQSAPKLKHESSKGAFEEMLSKYLSDAALLLSSETTSQMKLQKRRRKYAANLTTYERTLIGRLQGSLSLFEDERRLPVVSRITKLTDSLNWPAMYAARVVKFCRKFPTFNSCPKEVQLILLKRFYGSFLMLRAFFMFDFEKTGFYVLGNEAGTESIFIDGQIAKEYSKALMPLLLEYHHLSVEFRAAAEDDTVLKDLISLFTLFRPSEKLPNMEIISYEHAKCCHLLLHYLEQKHKVAKTAADKYRRIVRTFSELDAISRKGNSLFYKEFDISLFSDLLIELYDLQEE